MTANPLKLNQIDIHILLFIMLTLEATSLLAEIQNGVIVYDWFVAVTPFLWINVSVLFLYILLRGFLMGNSYPLSTGLARYMKPNFLNLRQILKIRRIKLLWLLFSLVYFLFYSSLQGMLVIDLSGRIEPRFIIVGGSAGYGPVIVWAPTEYFGFVLRPYLTSAALAIAIPSGLILAIFFTSLLSFKSAFRVLPAPLAGFAVLCPTCLTSPASAFVSALVSSLASTAGLAFSSLFSAILLVSTTLLIASLILIWMSISILSRIPVAGRVWYGAERP